MADSLMPFTTPAKMLVITPEDRSISIMAPFSILSRVKDFALEVAAKPWINHIIKPYGHMTTIQIDSAAKSIHIELDLHGEPAPLRIDVKSYTLSAVAGETFIELGEIETSREWINTLLGNFIKPGNKRFNVPAAVKVLL